MEDTQYIKKPYIIVGAGGFGREIYSWTTQSDSFLNSYVCSGFLDDDIDSLLKYNHQTKVIGQLSIANDFNSNLFLLGIANPNSKESISLKFESLNLKIIGFVHETTLIGLDSNIGIGLVTFPHVVISCNVTIGINVFINNGSQIGHDTQIGDYVSIMANVDIGGNCKIGNKVYVGSGATILPGINIPDNTIIGAGSVVFRNIKECGTYLGNPAKKIY